MFSFLAVDPSLRNTGYVYGQRLGENNLRILDYGVVETTPDMNNMVAVSLIFKKLTSFDYKILVAESLSGGAKSAKAAWSLAAAQSTLACVVLHKKCDYVEHTPMTIKKTINHYKKLDIIRWAHNKYPNLKWKFYRGKITISYNEHLADSLAIMWTTEMLKKWKVK